MTHSWLKVSQVDIKIKYFFGTTPQLLTDTGNQQWLVVVGLRLLEVKGHGIWAWLTTHESCTGTLSGFSNFCIVSVASTGILQRECWSRDLHVTYIWFSLFGANWVCISLARCMHRFGILSIGLLTWTRECLRPSDV